MLHRIIPIPALVAVFAVLGAAPVLAQPGAPETTAARTTCEAAIAKPPGGDTRFVTDVQAVARGWIGNEQLAKTPEGKACQVAINGIDDFRSAMSTAADEAAGRERVDATRLEHTTAAAAIAKNEKHVVLAYGAMWVLAALFLIFLWRRQQLLVGEIANLKRDLDAASK